MAPPPPSASARRPIRALHLMPDLAIGGGQTIVLSHVRHADRDRFDVRVASLGSRSDNLPAFRAAGVEPLFLDWERHGNSRILTRLVRLIHEQRIDVVHIHTALDRRLGQAAALVAGVPVVGHLHGMYNHLDHPARGSPVHRLRAQVRARTRAQDQIERLVVKRYVAASHAVAELFRPWVRAPITVIRPGIDAATLAAGPDARAAARRELGVGDDDDVVVDVARLVRDKGHDDLLRAAAMVVPRHPRLRVVLVGDGPERGALEHQAHRLGLAQHVRFTGGRTDVASLLAGADIFAFPSSYTEGLPVAPMEAMGAGLPVVAYAIPALEELVADGETGLLAEVGNLSALTTHLQVLLDDRRRRREIAASGQAMIARRYPRDATARDIEAAYQAVHAPLVNRARRLRKAPVAGGEAKAARRGRSAGALGEPARRAR